MEEKCRSADCSLKYLGRVTISNAHRRSQGVQWVHLHPQGGENFLGVIYRDNL